MRAVFRKGVASLGPWCLAAAAFAAVSTAAGDGRAAVIGKESRERFADYARRNGLPLSAVRERFGASGLLDCPGRLSSAQVVADRRIIVTTAHNLLNDDGSFPWALDACVFQLPGPDSKPVEVRVSARHWRFGTRWPHRDRNQDWAVLSLELPVPESVRPYRVADPIYDPVPRRGPVIVVAASHDNWRGRSRREASIERCRLRGIRVPINGRRDLLGFDCDTGKGASGAALLVAERRGYRLIGLGVGQRDRAPGSAYDDRRHFNAAIPFHQRIYDAVQSLRYELDRLRLTAPSTRTAR